MSENGKRERALERLERSTGEAFMVDDVGTPLQRAAPVLPERVRIEQMASRFVVGWIAEYGPPEDGKGLDAHGVADWAVACARRIVEKAE